MQHNGLDWGILTNGRLWRLYHKDTAHMKGCWSFIWKRLTHRKEAGPLI